MADLSSAVLNKRIFSVVIFTFFCYLSIGMPLAVLPGFVHSQLGFNPVVAGLIVSLQYFATLFSRPQSGRLADTHGPRRIVMLGLICCGLSGALTIAAALAAPLPWLSLTLLAVGRLFLGVGESFTSTCSILWGIHLAGSINTARVISWNGVATYLAMAMGAPLGVALNRLMGLSGFALLVAAMSLVGLWMAYRRATVTVASGPRAPFSQVLARVWPYGMGLGLGTVGFGVIATFITLFFASRGWDGAALALTLFSLGFVAMRLLFSQSIARHGGLKVSLASFAMEAVGLLVIWLGVSPWLVDAGALLTGAGFSLVFPALGVEAVKQVSPQNQGAALGTYSAFLDMGLGLTGPLAGVLVEYWDMRSIYLAAALVVILALGITLSQARRG